MSTAMPGHVVRARLRAALAAATARLAAAGVPSPSVDARALIARAARTEGPLVLLDDLPADFEEALEPLLERRAAREPLQLILGTAPFRRLEILVRPGVFIPRPETELAIDLLREHDAAAPVRRAADLCSGSGALAAAVLDELPGAEVTAVERESAAAQLAAENLGRTAPRSRWRVLRADVRDADALAGLRELDAVISNPPYVPPDAIPREEEVRRHDPAAALYGGGADGLDVPRAVLARAVEMLRPGGLLVMEHADVQRAAAREAARATGGLVDVRTVPDLTGRDRFLLAHRGPVGEGAAAGAGRSGPEVGD